LVILSLFYQTPMPDVKLTNKIINCNVLILLKMQNVGVRYGNSVDVLKAFVNRFCNSCLLVSRTGSVLPRIQK